MTPKAINVDLTESQEVELEKIKDYLGLKADAEIVRFLIHQFYLWIKENQESSLIGLLPKTKPNQKE